MHNAQNLQLDQIDTGDPAVTLFAVILRHCVADIVRRPVDDPDWWSAVDTLFDVHPSWLRTAMRPEPKRTAENQRRNSRKATKRARIVEN